MRLILRLVLLMILTGESYSAYAQFRLPAAVEKDGYFPGKIIFKVKPDFRASCRSNQVDNEKLNKAFETLGGFSINKKFPRHEPPASPTNARGEKLVDISLIYEANYNPQIPIEKAINLILATGTVEYAEPDYKLQLLFNPNDPDTASQYYLGLIHAYDAWTITQGDTNIVVGVTDTGTDLDHPDLAAGIKYNYADPINGIDDDGDGYIDNFQGWDLGENDNNPSVDIVHGSFVCGLAGAVTDNGTGIAGTGFHTRFLPIKISYNGVLTVAYDGIVYAADHGCHVINCSWGGFGGGQFGQDIVDYATFNKNSLVVSASGNNNNEAPFFPASYKNVLSVTGTNATDTKWVNSSYGAFVDISAPGEAVYSTIFDNNYSFSSGTSFASPIVAAGAALIKAVYTNFSPLQIAEQLRATSDDIDGIAGNAAYQHKLGKGRMNLYRALTETPKSVRMEQFEATDNNDDAFAGNDTLDITVYLKNYLQPLSNLNVVLTCNSPDITIINGSINPGAMATGATYDNSGNTFRVSISPTIAFNSKITFTLNFSDGTYTDWQIFDLVVNVDYINVLINDVGTSITSKGRIGYNEPSQVQGIGFTYNDGSTIFYEGGFLIGTDTTKVSDHLFGSPVSVTDDDFYSIVNVRKIIPSVVSDFDLDSRFNDDGAGANKLDVNINQKTFAWSTPADAKYIIVEYTISNTGASALSNLYAGIYADWDIGAATDNKGEYDAGLKMGYAYNLGSPTIYAGVKQLNSGGNNVYAFDNDGAGGTFGIYNGFTKVEKYQSMSTLRTSSGQAVTGNDVSLMTASGPHTIAAGDSIKVAFALLASDSLTGLQNAAIAAQIKYTTINTVPQIPNYSDGLNQNFPNPFNDQTTISYGVSNAGPVKIEILNVLGETIAILTDKYIAPGNYSVEWNAQVPAGIYFCHFKSTSKDQTLKLIRINQK